MTIQITEQDAETPATKRKHVTQVFKAGASTGIYIPKPLAECYGMDKAGTHVVIEGLDARGLLVRNVEDRLI